MKERLLGIAALLFDYFRKIGTVARGQFLSIGRNRRLLASIAVGILGALLLFWFVDKVIYYYLVRSYIDQVADVLDLNRHLINALVLLSFLAVVFFANLIWSFSKQKRRIGIAGVAALLVAHSLVLWFGTRDKKFDTSGTAVKCYVVTRDGTVTYGNRPGIDQATGRQCRPVTPEVVERLEEYRKGRLPQRVANTDPTFFSRLSGEPIVWYYQSKQKEIEIFDLMGFHPETGVELIPITKEIVETWRQQPKQRCVPSRVDPEKFPFFDPQTREPRVWYRRDKDGGYEFYDCPGFHTQTGQELLVITQEIADEVLGKGAGRTPNPIDIAKTIIFDPKTGAPRAWYWRGENISYEFFDGPGFHPHNGEPLKSFTKEAMQNWEQEIKEEKDRLDRESKKRAEEEEKRKRIPNPVDITKYDPFDPNTGAARVWYWRGENISYEFFDGPGFHPRNGESLKLFTKEAMQNWEREIKEENDRLDRESKKRAEEEENRKRIPNPVDIAKYDPFDPTTGAARVWYWRGENISYEFFDGPGFHPRNGEPLKLFTKEAMQNWEREIREEKDRLVKESKKRADEEEKRKHELAQKEEADKITREEARKRLTQAAGLCDELAANPSDSNRVGEGVSFDNLKAQAKEAVSNCGIAVDQKPDQLRFKYQLARALHWTDRKRAFDILQELVNQRYPAAFDNLGWLYLTERKDPARAIALFKSGTQVGDSDSMLSLAEMIERGHLIVANPTQEKLALYQRAAQLGNKTAITAYQVELAKVQNAERGRVQQLQQQQMMLQMLGGVLRNIH